MHDDKSMANKRCKLQHNKYARRKYSSEVKLDTDSVAGEARVVIAFAWRGRVAWLGRAGAEMAGEIKVHEAGEGEAEEGAGEDEP